MQTPITPTSLKLKRDEQLEITWSDGRRSVYPIRLLRARCPCATCRQLRETMQKNRLAVLPPGAGGPVVAETAEMVGNYALRIIWSDGHDAGIYSYDYLRDLDSPGDRACES
jgi:DUF971 family protein